MAAVTSCLRQRVLFDFFDRFLGGEILNDALARFETIETGVSLSRLCGHSPPLIDHDNLRQVVSHTRFEVVYVVRRSYLDCATTEFGSGVIISNKRDLAIH